MMELKVWVDGIQRVVCGVTIETTCQDVVIALAHAMGRTGRFTLIEKWRDVERPLTPAEQPLRVLHKWGEYACEVKLYLCQNDTDKVKQRDRHKQPDRFSHNFSPPKTHADSSIKRNLTFSGPHNVPSLKITHPPSRLQRAGILENGVSPRSSSNSSTSSRSSPHPVPAPRQHSPGNLPRPAPRNSPLLNGQISALPNKPNIRSQPFHQVNPPSNSYLSVSSNFQRPSPPSPNRGRSPSPQTRSSPVSYGQGTSPQRNSPSPSRTKSSVSNNVSPITPVEHNLDGPLNYRRASSEVEEYDLDVNFPDILRDSKRPEQQASHTEYHLEESSDTKPEPERARLLRLVTLQTERLKVQESQLDVIETEIVSLEEKELEYEQDLKRITDDLVELEQRDHDEEVEIADLSSVEWVEVLGQQQQDEKKISSEINELKQKLAVLETKVTLQKEKASELEKEVEKAKKEKEEKELEAARAREEEEKKTVEDQHQLRTELEFLVGKHQKEEEELLKITKEVTEVQEGLKVKETELADLEADLKKVNLEDFGTQSLSPTHGKPAETGEAVLKILEGRLSPRPQVAQTTPTQQAFINSLASKNPNGVWV